MDDKKLKKLALAIDLDTQTAKTTFREIERLDSDIENLQSDISVIQDDAQKIVQAIGEIQTDSQKIVTAVADLDSKKADKEDVAFQIATIARTPGRPGNNGKNGRNPLTVSKTEPLNPQKGDLWYKD